jgi:16S rRNA (guanine1207-N2)-methyltransferase
LKRRLDLTHYFTNTENLAHDRKEIEFRFLGVSYRFVTDKGVFSRTKPDEGSLYLLEAMLNEELAGQVLDMGCGYGLMSLILKHQRPHLKVYGVDVNERAIALANENAQRMQLELEFNCFDLKEDLHQSFDVMMSNPPIRAGKQVVYRFFDQAQQHLSPGGRLFLVIRRKQGAASATKALLERFEEVRRIDLKKGFEILLAQNPLTS